MYFISPYFACAFENASGIVNFCQFLLPIENIDYVSLHISIIISLTIYK